MNRIYITLMSALLASTSLAQPMAQDGGAKPAHIPEADPNLPLLMEQPEGTLYANYYGESAGKWNQPWGVSTTQIDGMATRFVVGDHGEVYLQNALSTYLSGAWIKGERTVGDTIAFNFPQKYCVVNETDYWTGTTTEESLYLWRMVKDSEGWFAPDESAQTIRYVLRNDSLIRIDTDQNNAYLGLGSSDGTWKRYCSYFDVWSKVKDALVQRPSTATPKLYRLDTRNTYDEERSRVVNVAIDGNDFYLGNLVDEFPDAWVKGHIEGDKLVFRGKTYLGVSPANNYHCYFSPIGFTRMKDEEYDEVYDSLYFVDELSLDYDAESQEVWNDNTSNTLFDVNTGKTWPKQTSNFYTPCLTPFTEVAGSPADPDIFDIYFNDSEGYGWMQIIMESCTADRTLLNQNKVFYNLYFDDQLYTFTPERYGVAQNVSDMPLTYSYGTSIEAGSVIHRIYFYVKDFKNVAVQLFYKDGGKVYGSHYMRYQRDSDGWLVNAIDNASADDGGKVVSVSYTDLTGRSVSQPAKGIYLKTVKYADGTQKTVKCLKR